MLNPPRLVAISVLSAALVAASTLGFLPNGGPATAAPHSETHGGGAYRWPLDGTPPVVRRFDPPPRPWLAGHRGADLEASAGVEVLAAGAGTIRFAGQVAGRGVVSIDHAGGLRTTYEPVSPSVRSGQPVHAGDQIGVLLSGHEKCPARTCLHWGLRRERTYLDPLGLLGLGRVRLYPISTETV